MGRVLVIGGSNTDLVCRAPRLPVAGETLNGISFDIFAGGKGANQAVAAARAAAAVTFAGAVGADDFGRARLADLSAAGIDVTHVEIIPGVSSGVALIAVDAHGENQIIVVDGANGAVSTSSVRAALDGSAWDVLLLVLEVPFEVILDAVQRSSGHTTIVLNAAPYDPRVRELLLMLDVLVCNEIEAADLLGSPVTSTNALDAVRALQALGSACAVITLGAEGAVAATTSDAWRAPAQQVEVVDTTGAGDTFCGALAAWLAAGSDLRSAVSAGVAAGSLAVTKNGAQPSIPTRDEIVRHLDSAIHGGDPERSAP